MTSKTSRSKLVFLGSATLAIATFATTLSAEALADIGRQGTLHIGAERLFGVVGTGTETEGQPDSSDTTFSLLWIGSPLQHPYDRPRGAVDYFVIDNLSVGGSLGFYTWSASVDDDNGDDDAGDGNGFLLAPRVGYMIGINDMLGFWPRGGLTYVRDEVDDFQTDTAIALSLEAPLVISIGRELALSIALTVDLGVGGEIERDPPLADQDQDHNQFGLQFSLDGFL